MLKKIIYINLDKDIDRRDNMDLQLKKIYPLIPFSRFSAFDREYVNNNKSLIIPRVHGTYLQAVEDVFPRPGAIGCFLSHERIIEDIINLPDFSDDDVYMVLEDDCKISKAFPEYLSEILKYIKDLNFEWTVLKPVYRKFDETHLVNKYLYQTSLSKDLDHNYYFGAHMLVYNGHNIKKLSTELRKRKLKDFDYIINKEIEGVYAFKLAWPEMVWQDNLGGSNTTDNQPWSVNK